MIELLVLNLFLIMNMKCGLSCVCNCKNAKDWALLALRVALGVIFVFHGYGKLWGAPGIEAFTGMIDKIGFQLQRYLLSCSLI